MSVEEVLVKMGLDSTNLRAGAASAKEVVSDFAEQSEHKIHKLHSALRLARMALDGFGVGALIGIGMEFWEKLHDFWIPWITGAEEAERATNRVIAAQRELGKANKEIEKQQADSSKEARSLVMGGMDAKDRKAFLDQELEAINKQRELAKKTIDDIRGSQWEGQGQKVPLSIDDAKRLADAETAYETLNAEQLRHLHEIQALEQEAQKAQEEADKKHLESLDQAAAYEDQITDKIRAEEASRDKSVDALKNAAANKFMPTEGEIKKSGYYDRGGNFHPSVGARMEMNIDAEKSRFLQDRLNGLYANNPEAAQKETNHIEEMQKQLTNYLGGESKTTADKIKDATEQCRDHLMNIQHSLDGGAA